MRFTLFLALVAGVCYTQQVGSEYYVGFTDNMGIDTPMTEENIECIKGVSKILSDVKETLERDYRDVDSLIDAAVEFIDRIYFEIDSSCKVFTGDFATFMTEYTGGTESLKVEIENYLDNHHSRISREIHCAAIANSLDQEHDGGALHANVFRMLLGLGMTDIPLSSAVLEEERRVNEEMRSDKTHNSVRAPKGVVDSSDIVSGDRVSEDEEEGDKVEDDSEIVTHVSLDTVGDLPHEIDLDDFEDDAERESVQLRNLQEL